MSLAVLTVIDASQETFMTDCQGNAVLINR